jgi:phosphatidylglycerol:prolipoprotein diacylglycerol transferase
MWPLLLDWQGTQIYAYPLFIGLAWGIGFRLAEARLPASIPLKHFVFWMLGLFISSWIGAKVLFILTQDRWATGELIQASNFWLGGGFVFLGGFLGGAIFTLVLGLIIPNLGAQRMQFTLVPLLWAHVIGRIGCLLAGCCYGTESSLPWSIHMHGLNRHPVQIYEALGLAGLALLLEKKWSQRLLINYLIGYGLLRWSLEWFRGDELRGLAGGQSSSQWVSIGMIFLGLIAFVIKSKKSREKN